jgi:ankyrin repeat protein
VYPCSHAKNNDVHSMKGHLDIVLQLLDKKVNTDVNKCRDSGESPLFIACQNGHDKIVEILLTHGADINKSK